MDWSQLVRVLTDLGLPALGTAVGGPLGGAAANMFGNLIAEALGVEPTPAAVKAAIAADPEAAKARLTDVQNARQHDIEGLLREAESSANARAMHIATMGGSVDPTPSRLAYLNAVGFYLCLIALIAGPIFGITSVPTALRDFLFLMIGAQIALTKDSQGFYFGTTRSSERNGAAVRAMAAAGQPERAPPR